MNAPARPALYRNFHRLAWFALIMTASTIMFGSFVRLSDAGLSCPDWPTCYGRVTWPQTQVEAAQHVASEIRPLESHKAWREQVHRFLAGLLGVEILVLALLAARRHRWGVAQVVTASVLVALAIPLYMRGEHVASSVLAIGGEAILLLAALRWSNIDLSRAAVLTLAVVIFQALLGMWTVTWLLKPIVVMGHLLGGMLMFGLLVWMAWKATHLPITLAQAPRLRWWLRAGLALLVLQIALGGWVSANYAALACGGGSASLDNFPRCVSEWWPQQNYAEGFTLWRGIGVDYEGGVLDGASRIAIQMAHRMLAVVLALYLLVLSARMFRLPGMRGWASALGALVLLQVTLGVLNVKLALPLAVAVMHNGGAVFLLFVLVSLLARLRAPE
ncbi:MULTISPECIES: COX15/CtaA family protein [Stenotrophomonas]|uniref:Cytochrome oxidase assembly protein n=1 Tax=Stenotrophomonas nitritireducens TaxID=83617 RepID=A0ABR5NN33_9GAMM|nr:MULTISPECIES: COX15/CtaA family protein [Stenotrophomonas]KQN97418.1 cytochrome oxidase assembly protein [Stenotrophomonas sp. Leaf70]KRG59422.1 cytochrome oxidase assembly protein [Stenotrophomonas nitritireducens]MBN8792893.1 COX15/CtaA family protein [Stenotrophomonas nitritireducens]MBN8797629.1 COX15/CtaA family protein [Stenotrophomonas nitritireducens]